MALGICVGMAGLLADRQGSRGAAAATGSARCSLGFAGQPALQALRQPRPAQQVWQSAGAGRRHAGHRQEARQGGQGRRGIQGRCFNPIIFMRILSVGSIALCYKSLSIIIIHDHQSI